MSITSRQNNLLLNQDWTRIYQTFKNADFKSYDFENLRRVIITYLRENYPEDFNDYIESSEYLALIDAIAFLGQSLSFRIDLASRENFIELAERKDSVLRLARLLGYNAKRCKSAKGLLKFANVATTEDVIDGNGRNLSNQIVSWNDPTNSNWAEQFILILNSAMADNTEFGRSQGSAVIQSIPTEQYRFRTVSTDIPVFTFQKNVAARSMSFEIVSTAFKNSEEIYEEAPVPGNQLGFIYRQDGRGPASANTGFYLMFKQGSLELAEFDIAVPTTNERVSVESQNINNDDIWLYSLNGAGAQTDIWTQVSSLIGNNIAYNSIANDIRNIYSVITRENDRVDLVFPDGVYGNLPQGSFRIYYRVANGLSYTIAPNEMRGINISFDYRNRAGVIHTLTIGLALQYTVSSAAAAEDIDTIRTNAPATYYTQNRMITGEDYNLAPLASSQDIIKVKAINRTSSGISRNFDILDATGKYSSIQVFADDGYIYKEEGERTLSFRFTNRLDIINFIRRSIEKTFSETDVYNFYLTKYDKILFTETNIVWKQITTTVNEATGYFQNITDATILKVGTYTTNNLKYLLTNSLVKLVPPEGFSFKRGIIVTADTTDPEQYSYVWTNVVSVIGDGTNAGRGVLPSGKGPVTFSDTIPYDPDGEYFPVISRIVPRFINDLPTALESEIVNLCFQNLNFGLRYDLTTSDWKIIQTANLNLTNAFSLGKQGDTTNEFLDSAWIIAFVKEADEYVIRIRTMDYIFGSIEQNRFYFDRNEKVYNSQTGKVQKDQIIILPINSSTDGLSSLQRNFVFDIDDTIEFDDGYESTKEIKLAFADGDDDGVIDNPQTFEDVAGEDLDLNYLFFETVLDSYGSLDTVILDNSSQSILIRQREGEENINNYADGQLIYFYDQDENRIKRVDKATNTFVFQSQYKARLGRRDIKFQYVHNASEDRRIDPSVSNIIDVYLLTRSYDTAYRNYLAGASAEPDVPTSDDLRITYGSTLSAIKSISDEIIYHPVRYRVLFGSEADPKLQAKFKVVKNPEQSINDNDLKVRIVNAIDEFFDINNWDFGDKFYVSELITYVINSVSPDVSNLIILPRQASQAFGSLFEIQSRADEILVSGASVDDIEIVKGIDAVEVRVDPSSVINSTGTIRSNSTTSSATSSATSSTTSSSGSGYY